MKKLITKCVMDMESLRWIPELEESCPYSGHWAYCFGGASSGDKADVNSERAFMDALQTQQATEFAGEQSALNEVQSAWSPIVNGGAYQYGFSTAEDQQLRGNIENAGATATQNTENSALLRQQQQSGGAGAGPAGATTALDAQLAETGAQQTATNLGQEKELGYEVGRENFENATKAETEVAQLENPSGGANAATGAANATNTAQNTVDTANANSLGSKLLGGLIQGGVSAATGGISSLISGGASGISTPPITGGIPNPNAGLPNAPGSLNFQMPV